MNLNPATNTEPAVTVGTAVLFLGAVLVLLQSFGVPISESQLDALKNVFILGIPIAGFLYVRSKVTPVVKL